MIIFPYKKLFNDFYPIIDVRVKSPRKTVQTEAFVDTGASTSIFRVAIAEKLGKRPNCFDFVKWCQ